MTNKNISKRQMRKMQKLQKKRMRILEKDTLQIEDKESLMLRSRTLKAIKDITLMTTPKDLAVISMITKDNKLEMNEVPLDETVKRVKSHDMLCGKKSRKDKTLNKTVSRVYYTARENVRVLTGKYVAFLFVFIALFTLYFSSNTLSRYTGEISSNGSLVVAKWDVGIEDSGDPKVLNIVSGGTASYDLVVTSASETASNYTIKLSNVPDDVRVQLDGGTAVIASGGIVTFPNAGSFDANANGLTANHTLTFVTTIDTDAVNDVDVDIEVEFVQEEL